MKPPLLDFSLGSTKALLVLACSLTMLQCGSDFDERSEIIDLRVLAVRADTPWLRPGESTAIEPLIVGEQSSPEPLSYRWRWCPLLGPNNLAFECLVTPELIAEQVNQDADISEDIYELGNSRNTQFRYNELLTPELVEEICLSIRAIGEIPTQVNLPECDGTFPISIRLDITDGEKILTVFKTIRLIYQDDIEPNSNPNISRYQSAEGIIPGQDILQLRTDSIIRTETATLPFDRGFIIELVSQSDSSTNSQAIEDILTPEAQLERISEFTEEPRQVIDDNGDVVEVIIDTREQITVSWFSDTGSFDREREGFLPDTIQPIEPDGPTQVNAWLNTRQNVWFTPTMEEFPGGQATIYVVVRDNREGISWVSLPVSIGEAIP